MWPYPKVTKVQTLIMRILAASLLLALLLGCKGRNDAAKEGAESVALVGRYEFVSDGQVVVDHKTRIIWKRCVDGTLYNKGECMGVPAQHGYTAASRLRAETASGGTWRLPTLEECMKLTNTVSVGGQGTQHYRIDDAVFPYPALGERLYYWCTSLEADGSVTLNRYGWTAYRDQLVESTTTGVPVPRDSPAEEETAMVRLVRAR